MPAFADGKALVLFGGETLKLLDAVAQATAYTSQAVVFQPNIDHYELRMSFASAPSAPVQFDVQTAVEDVEAAYTTRDSLTSETGEVMLRQLIADKFVRIKKVTQADGGACTISISPKRKG